MSSWFDKILPSFIKKESKQRSSIPEGLWKNCTSCSAVLYGPELENNLFVCNKCDHHIRIGARKRLEIFLDEENKQEISGGITPKDWLKFKDTKRYKERINEAARRMGVSFNGFDEFIKHNELDIEGGSVMDLYNISSMCSLSVETQQAILESSAVDEIYKLIETEL